MRKVLPCDDSTIALHEPAFAGREWDYVRDCLDSGWVSSVGSYVDRFERELATYVGTRHVVAVVNGTAALHICLIVSGVGAGDEVLIPALTFVATANAVAYVGAVPHLVDSDKRTLGIDPRRLSAHLSEIAEVRDGVCRNRLTGRRIAAVVPMHTFGHPVDMDELKDLANRYRLPVIEDATESLGSRYKGRPAGSLGHISAFSFNGNKVVTTGGGGAIATDDEQLALAARHLTTTAKVAHRWSFLHDQVGYNYRMPNINAALGCAQLEQLPGFISAKRRLAKRYGAAFDGLAGVRFFCEPDFAESNYWLNAVLLDVADTDRRDAVLQITNDAGLATRPVWALMHRLPMFTDCPRAGLAVAEDLEQRLINLPSSAKLGREPDERP